MVVQVTAASVQSHDQAFSLLQGGRQQSARLEKVCVDEGYQSNDLKRKAQEELKIEVEIVPKPSGGKGFQVAPRRWVVERTFAWMGRYRRLSKDYEYETATAEANVQLTLSHV